MLKDHLAGFRLTYIHLEVPPFRVAASWVRTGPQQAYGGLISSLSNTSFQLLFRKKKSYIYKCSLQEMLGNSKGNKH